MMQRRQAWMREYLLDMGQEPLSFVGTCQLTDNPKGVAKKIKDILEIKNGWAADCNSWQEALQMLIGVEYMNTFEMLRKLNANLGN